MEGLIRESLNQTRLHKVCYARFSCIYQNDCSCPWLHPSRLKICLFIFWLDNDIKTHWLHHSGIGLVWCSSVLWDILPYFLLRLLRTGGWAFPCYLFFSRFDVICLKKLLLVLKSGSEIWQENLRRHQLLSQEFTGQVRAKAFLPLLTSMLMFCIYW